MNRKKLLISGVKFICFYSWDKWRNKTSEIISAEIRAQNIRPLDAL